MVDVVVRFVPDVLVTVVQVVVAVVAVLLLRVPFNCSSPLERPRCLGAAPSDGTAGTSSPGCGKRLWDNGGTEKRERERECVCVGVWVCVCVCVWVKTWTIMKPVVKTHARRPFLPFNVFALGLPSMHQEKAKICSRVQLTALFRTIPLRVTPPLRSPLPTTRASCKAKGTTNLAHALHQQHMQNGPEKTHEGRHPPPPEQGLALPMMS